MYFILLGLLLSCQRFANKTESSFFCWLTLASLPPKSQVVFFLFPTLQLDLFKSKLSKFVQGRKSCFKDKGLGWQNVKIVVISCKCN